MNWYYADGSTQVGPFAEADFDNLIANGTVKPDTLVWREGMAEWRPCSEVKPVGGRPLQLRTPPTQAGVPHPAGAPASGGVVCCECGNTFPPDEMIRHGSAFVCAACKPIFVQKLKEGLLPGASTGRMVTIEEVLARDYQIDFGGIVSQAWQTYKSHFGIILGATVLVMVLTVICGMIPFGVGALAQLILQGPLMGGLYLFYIQTIRGESVGVGAAFSGFGPRFVQLMLTHLVSGILAGMCIVPAIILFLVGMFSSMHANRHGTPDFTTMGAMLIPAIILGIVGVFAMVYLTLSWMFALPLVADKRMGFWAAMGLSRKVVGKHWWGVFALMFIGGLIAALGLLGCIVGVLFTMPIAFAMTMHLYEQVLGDLAPQDS